MPVRGRTPPSCARRNSFCIQRGDDLLAQDRGRGKESQHVPYLAVGIVQKLGDDFLVGLQSFQDPTLDRSEPLGRRFHLSQLHDVHRRLDLGHAVVGAAEEFAVVVGWGKPHGPPQSAAFGNLTGPLPEPLALRQDQAAFAAADGLVRRYAEAAQIADRAHMAALETAAAGLRAVFNHLQLVLPRHLHDCAHVANAAHDVRGRQGHRSRRDQGLDLGGVHRQRGVDIAEYRDAARFDHGRRRGKESDRRADDLTTGPNARRHKGAVQGTGA